MKKPKVICICGSTRFADIHAVTRWELEREGNICLMINYLPKWYVDKQVWKENHHIGEQAGNKLELDELHFRKIDLSDEIFVVNVYGYIGESTNNEIEYAKSKELPIVYLEPIF